MENLSLEHILDEITKICQKYQVEHLYLFGSYATGTATSTSDIDIIIKGGTDFWKLKDEIDAIPTLKKIDIFEQERCSSKFLKEDMEQYGRQIY